MKTLRFFISLFPQKNKKKAASNVYLSVEATLPMLAADWAPVGCWVIVSEPVSKWPLTEWLSFLGWNLWPTRTTVTGYRILLHIYLKSSRWLCRLFFFFFLFFTVVLVTELSLFPCRLGGFLIASACRAFLNCWVVTIRRVTELFCDWVVDLIVFFNCYFDKIALCGAGHTSFSHLFSRNWKVWLSLVFSLV